MVAMMTISCGSHGGNPVEITDSLGSGTVQGPACTQASPTVVLSAGSIVAGHLETPAGTGLGAREEMGSSFQPSPEAMAVTSWEWAWTCGQKTVYPHKGSPKDQHPQPSLQTQTEGS